MVKEQTAETANGNAWVQDQLYQVKAQTAQLDQQLSHLQSIVTQLIESAQGTERSLRETAQGATLAFRLQEEINQSVALIVHLQDGQGELKQRVDDLSRVRDVTQSRDQEEWLDLVRRTDQLERHVAAWHDRQAGADEASRRMQEVLSLARHELQQIEQRLQTVEGKAARALEGATRAEHTLTQTEAAITALQHEDEAIAERTRVASDMAHRLEATLNQHLHELQRVELLAERIELHRAERQRLEDRALRLEEGLNELRELTQKSEDQRARLAAHQQGLGARLDAIQEQIEEQRVKLVDQLRRLTGSQERTKRRQVQELERELREMRQYVAELADK
jgi:chromosome segregation ATPase